MTPVQADNRWGSSCPLRTDGTFEHRASLVLRGVRKSGIRPELVMTTPQEQSSHTVLLQCGSASALNSISDKKGKKRNHLSSHWQNFEENLCFLNSDKILEARKQKDKYCLYKPKKAGFLNIRTIFGEPRIIRRLENTTIWKWEV